MHVQVAIVGSGPAGLTAAIYASRALLTTAIFTGLKPGGQLMDTTEVENYPGFPEGIMGPELMEKMQAQAKRFGAEFIAEDVVSVSTEAPFTLTTSTQEVTVDTVIIATGSSPKYLGLESEQKFSGRGVSYCATCDGFFFRDKEIAVVGGGDTAMEEATFLTRFAKKVYVIHRRDELRASKIMQEKAKADPKIEFVWNSAIEEIIGDKVVSSVKLKNTVNGEESNLDVQGVFVAIGHDPNSKFIAGTIDTDPNGYVMIDDHYRSSVEGIFVAGDIHDHHYRQAVTAAGAGCAASLEAERYLALKA